MSCFVLIIPTAAVVVRVIGVVVVMAAAVSVRVTGVAFVDSAGVVRVFTTVIVTAAAAGSDILNIRAALATVANGSCGRSS